MEIQGFYFDKQRKKYFRIESGINGQNVLTKDHLSQTRAFDSIDSYRRVDTSIHLPQSLCFQEINKRTKFNLREELIRSQLKSLKPLKRFDLEVIDFKGNLMNNICADLLICSPINDQLFAVLSGDSGSVVYHFSVKDIFDKDFDLNRNKHIMNSYPPRNRVIDISYQYNNEMLSTLVHHFPDKTATNTSISLTRTTESSVMSPQRLVYEFPNAYFSATHFCDMNIIGGENEIRILKPSFSGQINRLQVKGNVTALKTTNDGKQFIAGTNRGELYCFDIRENFTFAKSSSLKLSDKSIIYLHILNDNNSVIASSHNNNISLIDFRMIDKPVLLYSNHVNECKKIPLTVDESVGIMCSSGDDNIVRFWSIKSAKLLHMYCPLNTDVNHNHNQLPSLQPLSQVSYSHSWKCLNKQFKPLIFSLAGNQFNVITTENLT
jgi:WD40 repeat protein